MPAGHPAALDRPMINMGRFLVKYLVYIRCGTFHSYAFGPFLGLTLPALRCLYRLLWKSDWGSCFDPEPDELSTALPFAWTIIRIDL